MKIAFDGGAFQQSIDAGISKVATGLLNAIFRLEPNLEVFLICDPRLGEVNNKIVDRLDCPSEFIFDELNPLLSKAPKKILTSNPMCRFNIDGKEIFCSITDGKIVYRGPSPKSSFKLITRSARPIDIDGSPDDRLLGVDVKNVNIITKEGLNYLVPSVLQEFPGFWSSEESHIWTSGCVELPKFLFPRNSTEIVVEFIVNRSLGFQLMDGAYDKLFGEVVEKIDDTVSRILTLKMSSRLRAAGVNIYIANHFLPINFPGMINMSILHDVIPLIFPSYFHADARKNFDRNVVAFEAADHVFSVSKASKDDLVKFTKVQPGNVTVCHNDVGNEFIVHESNVINEYLSEIGLDRNGYILSVGTIEPRKNNLAVIDAFKSACKSFQTRPKLVFVGKLGWDYSSFLNEIQGDVDEFQIVHLNDLTDIQVSYLYGGALFSVYVSLYEGFGLPVLESMACGCPVITSDRSSLKEVAGGAAYLVDPTDVRDISKAIFRLFEDEKLRNILRSAGLARRADFSWNSSAARVLDVIRDSKISE